jgi:hypothetical protein
MTYRERRERRAERLRGWADKRQRDARATFAAHEQYRGDVAFNTQPGHIPERARVIAREDRAFHSLQKADRMDERASNIESQLDHAIYSDDPDAIERLAERVADLEAERDRIKAYNVSARKGAPNLDLLDDAQRADLLTIARVQAYALGKRGEFPGYVLSNLGGNITRNRQRLESLRRQAVPRELVTVPVGDGLAGYPPPPNFAKVAMIRTGDAPIGYPGSLCLNCPCGQRPATELDGPDVTCACGVIYSFNGWRRAA